MILDDPNAYAYFLYNCQNFNINLIHIPVSGQNVSKNQIPLKTILEETFDTKSYDAEYVEKVDEVKEENINSEIAQNVFKNEPKYSETIKGIKVLKNPIFGKIAIQCANYKCIVNEEHITFESKVTGKNFMEAHHLVPMKEVKNIFELQNINIDCVENLVSLCPNCHRAVHYGADYVKRNILTNLLDKKKNDFDKIGLKIEIYELLKMY
jgi:5-methylcytosine-specific restriction protein A